MTVCTGTFLFNTMLPITVKYYRLGVQRGDLRTCSLRSERWHIGGGDRAYQQQPLWSWSVLQYAAQRLFSLFVIWPSWYLILKEMEQPSSQPMVRPPGNSQPILMLGRSVWALNMTHMQQNNYLMVPSRLEWMSRSQSPFLWCPSRVRGVASLVTPTSMASRWPLQRLRPAWASFCHFENHFLSRNRLNGQPRAWTSTPKSRLWPQCGEKETLEANPHSLCQCCDVIVLSIIVTKTPVTKQ